MNLKIQTGAADASSALEIARTDAASRTGSSHGLGSAHSAGNDSVSISDLSSRISDALSAADAATTKRVSELSALYARGGYQVDAGNLSRTIVNRALDGTDAI